MAKWGLIAVLPFEVNGSVCVFVSGCFPAYFIWVIRVCFSASAILAVESAVEEFYFVFFFAASVAPVAVFGAEESISICAVERENISVLTPCGVGGFTDAAVA